VRIPTSINESAIDVDDLRDVIITATIFMLLRDERKFFILKVNKN